MGIIVPTLSNGVMTGAGRTAVVEAVGDLGRPPINVTDVRYGADPTGVRDSTGSIQAAIAAAAAQGKGSVEIPAGVYRVSPPFMSLAPEVTVFGHGDATIIVATGNAPAEKIGVFHIGSYNKRLQDPRMYRAGLRDLMIKTGDGSQSHQPAIPNVCGVILNTDLGSSTPDPDAVHKVSGLTIWDMHIGMAILGRDDQGMKISDVRIRGGQECGLLVGKPPSHPEMLDGSQGKNPGGADNKFSRMDVSSANKDGADRAGIEVYTSNCKFSDSTSWYSQRHHAFDVEPTVTQDTRPAFLDAVRDGAGWYVHGTKNLFTACTAQENGGHGFVMVYPGSVVTGCIAESSAFYDSVKGTAKVNEAHGFMLLNGASDTQLMGCRSGNARGADKGQGYGYYLENYARGITLLGTAAVNATGDVRLGKNLGSDVVVRVGSTLLNWVGATTAAGAGTGEPGEPGPDPAAPARPAVTAERFLSQETFTIAHRGSGDVFPEHTLEAYRGSVAQGAEAVEVSVRVTADGVPVCIHDDSLVRTTGVEASVAGLTLAELQAIPVHMGKYLGPGSPVTRVPTLDEALQVLAGRAVVFLEPKVTAAVAPVLAAVEAWGIGNSTVFKTYHNGAGGYGESSVLQQVKAAGMTTWCYVDAGDELANIETLAGHADMIGVPFFGDVDKDSPSSMPREKIKQVVAFGTPVIAWEVHRLADREMLAGLGVRGFMSPQWALLAGDLAPRRATRFSSRQRVAGEQIGPDNTAGWAPTWDGASLVMDQTWDASYCLGAFATADTYTLRASWAWTSNTPTAGGTHAGIVFGASSDEAWGFGSKHKTSTSGSYLLIRRGDGRLSLLKYAPGATGGVALGELKGPKPVDGVPLEVAVEVTPEQLRVTATGVDGEIVSKDADCRGSFIHLARNHGTSAGGHVAYGHVVVS